MNHARISRVVLTALVAMAECGAMAADAGPQTGAAGRQTRPVIVSSQSGARLAPVKPRSQPPPQPNVQQVSEPAQEPPAGSAGGVGLTAKIGTLGPGLEATIGASDYLGFRFGLNGMNLSPSSSRDEGDISTDLEWLSYGILADLHPFGGGFRISGGGLVNKNKFKLKADLTESVELDGRDYYLDDLQGQVTFNELAPYLGIGYGNAVGADGRWHFSCDFGVMFQGAPKISARATASDPVLQPAVDAALEREVEDIQDDADAYQYYPVISLGVSYRF